ncbi:hypothetical protein [Pseudomonas sp. WS 5079]|uniref:hypothetical protein n=1 Tax=Pseudomonas sp. WS 5079 TaxID=2717492 RepID=UPI0015526E3C|nr:hypothetical protein [Pseudomonas sp. WS 5079]NMX65018.1 hypothetical protein [Pseudomonas sp. WS 5079]
MIANPSSTPFPLPSLSTNDTAPSNSSITTTHPDSPLKYDPAPIIIELNNFGKNELFTKLSASNSIKLTPYDKNSVTHDHLPAKHMADGITNSEHYELSSSEKYLADSLFPSKNSSLRQILLITDQRGSFSTYEWALAAPQSSAPQEQSE